MYKTAILLGSTGLTGSYLLQILLESERYEKVICFARKKVAISHPKLTQHIIDFDSPDSYRTLVEGDDLYCCLGTTIKKAGSQAAFAKIDLDYPLQFAKTAVENGIKQYLIVSALGANAQSGNFYMRTKGQCEEQLHKIPLQSISIFQPSLLLGDRKEFRLGEKLGEYAMKIISVLLIGKLRKYRAIKAEQVANAMYAIAQQENKGYHTYPSDEIAKMR